MDLQLQSKEALRELMEIATGESYADYQELFGEPHETSQVLIRCEGIMKEDDKRKAVKRAMLSAGRIAEGGQRVKRMKVAQAAISRRVTASRKATFGHQARTQAYGQRRWKTSTGALLAAEKIARMKHNSCRQ